MSELQGQMDMSALMGREQGTGNREREMPGYDAEGRLLAYPEDVYAAIAADDADRLRYLAAGIRSDFDGARERVLHMGMLLMEARNRCPEGRWLQWLNEEARVPERTAQQAIQLYATYGTRELPENLSVSHLVELLRAPEEDRDALAKKAAEEGLSTRQLKDEIKQLREEYQYSRLGIDFRVMPEECTFIRAMDAQRQVGKAIFGSGLLLSERAAAERAAADRAAADRAAAEREATERATARVWELSDREKDLVASFGGESDEIIWKMRNRWKHE